MSKITVYLDRVKCSDTEDWTGADHFYLIGEVRPFDGSDPKGFITKPIRINDDEDRVLGSGGGRVFHRELPEDCEFQIEMIAYDQDAAADAEHFDEATQSLNEALANNLHLKDISPIVLSAIGTGLSLDKDDNLGTDRKRFTVGDLPNGRSRHKFKFAEDGLSSWDYEVTCEIKKS